MWTPELRARPASRYLAIAEALGEDVAAGRLRPGTRLPTHRELAERLGVTVGTVTRAYAEAARRGLVSGEVGRGTFVRRPALTADRREAAPAGTIDLSANIPPESAGERRRAALARTLAALSRGPELSRLLAYPPDGGDPAHRAAGAEWVRRAGLDTTAEQVLVSSGSQHGMTAVFAALLSPGDLVLTEALTYAGMKALAGLLNLRLQGLAMDEHGLRPEALAAACRQGGAKALYCVPTLHNPTTVVMPEARRREIAAIARRHGVLLVEDDVHGRLMESPPRPLSCFAPELAVYLSGTSKTVAPGLRVGFIAAPEPMVPRLAAAIRGTIWMAAPLMAEIAANWIREGTAEAIVRDKRKEAALRQRLAARVLEGLPVVSHPAAYHLWLPLPEPWRSEAFADAARRRGVVVTPAAAFAVGRSAPPEGVRVCLGTPRERGELERGLRLLRTVLEAAPEPASLPLGP